MHLLRRKNFRVRVSRTSVLSSAGTLAKLAENVSEIVNFGPTKGAAKIVQQMLETIKEVDDNDDARVLLIKRVVDILILIREYFYDDDIRVPAKLNVELQEFELVLLGIYEAMKRLEGKSFASRALARERIKSVLASRSAGLDAAISKLNLSLLLRLNASASMALAHAPLANDSTSRNRVSCAALFDRHETTFDSEDDFLEKLRNEYEELRTCDIELGASGNARQSAVVTFSGIRYAFVKDKRRLVKQFRGDDARERKEWLEELKHWHRLKHPNLLQLYGFSKKTSPHLFIVFQNGQARCLATYMLNAINSLDVPSIADIIVKMINSGASAIKHAASQFRLSEASSALVAQESTFALDSGDNLIVSMVPPNSVGGMVTSLFYTLIDLLFPHAEFRRTSDYFARLSVTGHSFAPPATGVRQSMAAVEAFMNERHWEFDVELKHIAKIENPGQIPLTLVARIDYECEVRAGDYGIIVPGQEEDFSCHAFGNVADDSSGIISVSHGSDLIDFTSYQRAPEVPGFPHIWSLDLNEDRRRGYSRAQVGWRRFQYLNDKPRAMQYFVNSAPFLEHANDIENLILVTEVRDFKRYGFSFQGVAHSDPIREETPPETSIASDGLLPAVYLTEPGSGEQELQVSQCYPGACPSTCGQWDPRFTFEGNMRQYKYMYYIQLRKEDIINRFGRVPKIAKKRAMCSTGPIIQSSPRWWLFQREYEHLVQKSEPWYNTGEV